MFFFEKIGRFECAIKLKNSLERKGSAARFLFFWSLVAVFFLETSFQKPLPPWGFFGHKKINRLAVFTLPPDMLPLFKTEIEYLTEQAVAPDKRRFVAPEEGFRHYIDLDRWAFLPVEKIDAQILHTAIFIVTEKNDTLQLTDYQSIRKWKRDYFWKHKNVFRVFGRDSVAFADSTVRQFFYKNLKMLSATEPLAIAPDSLMNFFKKEKLRPRIAFKAAFARDFLTPNGILPYHLEATQRQLTDAFMRQDRRRVLKIAAELGHYLADAHVPLHTVSNYDGQKTQQNGIHAFWESRLPELFAEAQYDFFVGRAEYIPKTRDFFWKVVEKSYALSAQVLAVERAVSAKFPPDQRYCSQTMLGGAVIQKPCEAYARAYHDALGGMVEAQMRAAILAVGAAWYTAWVDAGQPNLMQFPKERPLNTGEISEEKQAARADSLQKKGNPILGRSEDN
jgi:hypothetical protein